MRHIDAARFPAGSRGFREFKPFISKFQWMMSDSYVKTFSFNHNFLLTKIILPLFPPKVSVIWVWSGVQLAYNPIF